MQLWGLHLGHVSKCFRVHGVFVFCLIPAGSYGKRAFGITLGIDKTVLFLQFPEVMIAAFFECFVEVFVLSLMQHADVIVGACRTGICQ